MRKQSCDWCGAFPMRHYRCAIPRCPFEQRPDEARYHHKRDGVLRIAHDDSCRYLTMWERVRFFFGGRP